MKYYSRYDVPAVVKKVGTDYYYWDWSKNEWVSNSYFVKVTYWTEWDEVTEEEALNVIEHRKVLVIKQLIKLEIK